MSGQSRIVKGVLDFDHYVYTLVQSDVLYSLPMIRRHLTVGGGGIEK